MGTSKSALSYFSLPFLSAPGAAAPPPSVVPNHMPNFRLRHFGPAPSGHYKASAGQHSPNNIHRPISSAMQPTMLTSSSASSSGTSSPNAVGGHSRSGQSHYHNRHSRPEPDNNSLEGLLPSSSQHGRNHYHHQQRSAEAQGPTTSHMVRFEDNWL